MRLVSFQKDNAAGFGRVENDRIVDLKGATRATSLKEAIAGDCFADLRDWQGQSYALTDVQLLPVLPDPGKILCVGLNYDAHVKETGRSDSAYPAIFTRFADSQQGHLQPLIKPKGSDRFDYEGELAVVIGKGGSHIKAAQALAHVAGYSCYNEGSVRDWQRHTHQFTPGKNFPKTGGFGPWLVTADEIPDPQALKLETRLNGQVVQSAPTADMIFPVADIIEYISGFTPLAAGDVIVTGTPGGVGDKRTPPLYMFPGDIAEVEISQIGVLRNAIAEG